MLTLLLAKPNRLKKCHWHYGGSIYMILFNCVFKGIYELPVGLSVRTEML